MTTPERPSDAAIRYSDDDLNVILQDWSESNPDQAVAINLASELLQLRKAAARPAETSGGDYATAVEGWRSVWDDLHEIVGNTGSEMIRSRALRALAWVDANRPAIAALEAARGGESKSWLDGFGFIADPAVPNGEIRFVQNGEVVGTIKLESAAPAAPAGEDEIEEYALSIEHEADDLEKRDMRIRAKVMREAAALLRRPAAPAPDTAGKDAPYGENNLSGEWRHNRTAAPQTEGDWIAMISGIDEYGPMLDWNKHWSDVGVGTKLYTQAPRVTGGREE